MGGLSSLFRRQRSATHPRGEAEGWRPDRVLSSDDEKDGAVVGHRGGEGVVGVGEDGVEIALSPHITQLHWT